MTVKAVPTAVHLVFQILLHAVMLASGHSSSDWLVPRSNNCLSRDCVVFPELGALYPSAGAGCSSGCEETVRQFSSSMKFNADPGKTGVIWTYTFPDNHHSLISYPVVDAEGYIFFVTSNGGTSNYYPELHKGNIADVVHDSGEISSYGSSFSQIARLALNKQEAGTASSSPVLGKINNVSEAFGRHAVGDNVRMIYFGCSNVNGEVRGDSYFYGYARDGDMIDVDKPVLKWQYPGAIQHQEYSGLGTMDAVLGPVLTDSGFVVFSTSKLPGNAIGGGENALFALNAVDGTLAWTQSVDHSTIKNGLVKLSPLFLSRGGNRRVYFLHHEWFYIFDETNGEELDRVQLVGSDPAVAEDAGLPIFVDDWEDFSDLCGTKCGTDPVVDANGHIVVGVYQFLFGLHVANDVAELVWWHDLEQDVTSAPAVAQSDGPTAETSQGRIYVAANDAYCFDLSGFSAFSPGDEPVTLQYSWKSDNCYEFAEVEDDDKSAICTTVMNGFEAPPFLSGDGQALFLDDSGQLWGINGDNGDAEWYYDYGFSTSETEVGPIIDRAGRVLVPFGATGLVATGGTGGCSRGRYVNPRVSEQSPELCIKCAYGTVNSRPEQTECVTCEEGTWQGEGWHSFECFVCPEPSICLGGSNCSAGRADLVTGETALGCSNCVSGYFEVSGVCRECPDGSIWNVLFFVILFAVLLFLWKFTRINSYTSATEFCHQLKRGDLIRLAVRARTPGYKRERKFCRRVLQQLRQCLPGSKREFSWQEEERRVKKVVHDYQLELEDPPFSNEGPVSRVRYKIGRINNEKVLWSAGTGLVDIEFMYGMQTRRGRCLKCFTYKVPPKKRSNWSRKTYGEYHREKPVTINGRATSGTQVLGTACVVGIAYVQMTTIFMSFELDWPPELTNFELFVVPLQLFNFNLPDLWTAPSCNFDFSYTDKYFLAAGMPMALMGIFGARYLYAEKMYQNIKRRKQIQSQCIQCSLIIIVMLYVFINSKIVEPFDCQTQADGVTRMDMQPSIECTKYEGDYAPLFWGATVLFAGYGFLVPYFLFMNLYKAYKQKRMGNIDFIQKYGFLYMRYNREFFYWEIVVLGKKLMLVLVNAFNNEDPIAQANWAIGILSVSLAVTFHYKPYICYRCLKLKKRRCYDMSPNDRLDVSTTLVSIIMLLVAKEYSTNPTQSLSMIIIGCILLCVIFIGHVIFSAWRQNKKETKKLKKDGLFDDRQDVMQWMQKALAI